MGLEEALALCPDEESVEDLLKRSPGNVDTTQPPPLETQFMHGQQPAAEGPRAPSIYFAIPSGGSVNSVALPSIIMPTRHLVKVMPMRSAAGNYNHLWCNALNSRKVLNLTHFAMHHADIGAPPFWLDFLISELERYQADVISAVVPIKDTRGLTSTAVRNNKTRHIRRITITELKDLPPTFGLKDLPWANEDDALLLNNALWVCRFTEPWVEEVCFHFNEFNIKRPDGQFQAGFFSEDWEFSEWCTVKGLKLMATHKLPIIHEGRADYVCDGSIWGDWKEEQGDTPRI